MKILARTIHNATLTSLILILMAGSAFAYTDIDSSDKDFDEIDYFESLDLIDDSEFEADRNVTKAEFVRALLDKSGFEPSSVDEYPVNFVDVDGDLAPYVEQMRKLGIIIYTPYSNEFNPDSNISLRKALDMYMKFDGVPVPKVFDKADFNSRIRNIGSDAFFAPTFARAVRLGLIRGGNVDAFAPLTRRQLAYMIYHGDGLQQKFEEASGKPTQKKVTVKLSNVSEALTSEPAFRIFEDVWDKLLKE